ncbi:hypothetical protein DFR28_1115 [Arenicella xantha]|uniref:Uncharacterized protein n=1 Tax=Arenicella xantha TaxID=644221 RepID=A0A395JK01_9GAMM|nr:hypothetical protein DFR28_1115 [Arenicella xantha]
MRRTLYFSFFFLLAYSQSCYAGNVQRTIIHTESLESGKWLEILGHPNYKELSYFRESAKLTIETCDFLSKTNCDYYIIREGRTCKNTIKVKASCKESKCEYQFEKTTLEQCLE